jgi:hypothetical protein
VLLNSAHIHPHLLLNDAEFKSNEIAEKQFVSLIKSTRVPSDVDIMPVVDVSGSMTGTPMEVAIALGLVVSYSQCFNKAAAYERLFLTFDCYPSLFKLPPIFMSEDNELPCSLAGTVARFMRMKPWGGSTDFNASMRLMLQVLKKKYPEGTSRRQILMVFTDMQFDSADSGNKHISNFSLLQQEFRDARVPLPTIVFWNIRGDVSVDNMGLPTDVQQKNVVYLSGYSADLLRDFFSMLGQGQFCSSRGEAEADPNVEGAGSRSSARPDFSTKQVLEVVETSPMYNRYKLWPI